MRKQLVVLVLIGLALLGLGQWSGRGGAWAAPGQAPERQSYPSITPSLRPGDPTNTLLPPPDTPPPGGSTETPVLPTDTPISPSPAISETPSPVAGTVIPAATGTPTAASATLSPAAPRPSATWTPQEPTETEIHDTPIGSPDFYITPSQAPTETRAQDTREPAQPSPSSPAASPTAAPGETITRSVLGPDWMLICGSALIAVALLLLVLGRRRREDEHLEG